MAFGKRKAYVALGVVAVLGYVVIYLVPGGSLPVAVIAWFLFGAGTGGTNAMMFSMRADSVDYGEWKTDIRSEGGSYSILSFIRKCGQGIGGAMGAAIIGAFGYVAKAPTRSPDVLHGIRLAAGGAPAVLAVAAVAVMFFYPLTATEHRSLVAELNECRTRRAAGETLGLDAEELGVVQLGDGRSLRLTRSDAPVITLFEREGPGGTEIGSKVAQALGVGFTGQRFSSREISQLDDDVVTPNGFDRFVRSLSWSGTSESALAQALEESVDNRLADQATREVLEAVSDGGVVMGRNAAFILHSALGSFHVPDGSSTGIRTATTTTTFRPGLPGQVPAQQRHRVGHQGQGGFQTGGLLDSHQEESVAAEGGIDPGICSQLVHRLVDGLRHCSLDARGGGHKGQGARHLCRQDPAGPVGTPVPRRRDLHQ